jgi:hypothetical protein
MSRISSVQLKRFGGRSTFVVSGTVASWTGLVGDEAVNVECELKPQQVLPQDEPCFFCL